MTVGDFRSRDLKVRGWLEEVRQSDILRITSPKDGQIFKTNFGKNKKQITVSGILEKGDNLQVMVVMRTDRDYPKALGKSDFSD